MNDFNRMSEGMGDRRQITSFFDPEKPTATLILNTPRRIHKDTRVRPILYNFGEDLIEDVSKRIDASVHRKGEEGIDNNLTESMLSAAIPSAEGNKIRTDVLSDSFTFVLTVDQPRRVGVTKRAIASGIVIGVPFDPSVGQGRIPTIDMMCVLKIEHCTFINIETKFDGRRNKKTLKVRDAHAIDMQLDQFSDSPSFLLNNNSLRKANLYSEDAIIRRNSKGSIAALDKTVLLETLEGEPKSFFKEMGHTLASAASSQLFDEMVDSPLFETPIYVDPARGFINTFDSHTVSNGYYVKINKCIETKAPILLDELDRAYPNLNVVTTEINRNGFGFEERPQINANHTNIMSSLMVSCLNSIAPKSQLCEIVFRYDSFREDWDLGHFGFLNNVGESQANCNLDKFKKLMEMDVFPILLNINGDFDIIVNYDLTGEVIIDLHFLDSSKLGGYYIHQNRLGGMVSSNIGNENDFSHNGTMLNGFLNGISMNVFAGSAINDFNDSRMGDSIGYDDSEVPSSTQLNFATWDTPRENTSNYNFDIRR